MGRKVVIALALALVVSLGLNVFLAYLALYYYRESLRLLEGSAYGGAVSAPVSWSWINVVAVSSGGEGVVLRIYAKIENGSGRVYMATTPKVGIDLQSSAETAYSVASRLCGFNMNSHDVFLVVTANFTVDVVDGPSAGASITVLLASIMMGKAINSSIIMTGTVEPDGSVGRVGGIVEKAMAAARAGAKLFIVPRGQTIATIYIERQRQWGPFIFITREPITVNVQEYLESKGYSIKILEVSNIPEAINHFIK